jgi:hypothetical protein
VNSRANPKFWRLYHALPEQVQGQARLAYRQFRVNPGHPGLEFKKVHPARPIYSARVGIHYRAVGVTKDEEIIWFWIGPHSEYDKLLSRL